MLISDFTYLKRLLGPRKVFNLYHFKPIQSFSIDSRNIKEGEAFIALAGKHNDGHNFINEAAKNGAALIIAQKDITDKPNIPFFLVDDTYEALRKIASYVRKRKRPFVYAITGSVGKTTTKEMLGFLLEDKFKVLKNYKTENNILGVGKTIFSLSDEEIMILELGTNQPGEIKALSEISYPDVGVITFIKPVHLEGLKSLRGIFEEKISLLKVNPKIQAVLNRDDSYLRKVNFCKRIHWFGKGCRNETYARLLKRTPRESIFLVQGKYKLALSTPFDGFIYNVLAAMTAAKLKNLPLRELVEKMNCFNNFLPQRMQIQETDDFIFINDAYNANPYSFKETLKIVKRYPLKKIAIIGDMLELGEKTIFYHQQLAKDIMRSRFDYVLTLGDCTPYLNEKLNNFGHKGVFHFSSHKEIASFIKKKAKKRYVVFLKGSRKIELEKVISFLNVN
jgi:UDP-N-acetylmuramoyl-tripeptide--D-alanyl-D-alanine ligase